MGDGVRNGDISGLNEGHLWKVRGNAGNAGNAKYLRLHHMLCNSRSACTGSG